MANLLASLSPAQRLLYPIVRGGVSRGLSGRAILDSVRAAGLRASLSRTIGPMMRAIQAADLASSRLRYIPKGSRINVDRLPMAVGHQRRRYSYLVRARGMYNDDEPAEVFVTIASDRSDLTVNDILAEAHRTIELHGERYAIDVEQLTIMGGSRRDN